MQALAKINEDERPDDGMMGEQDLLWFDPISLMCCLAGSPGQALLMGCLFTLLPILI